MTRWIYFVYGTVCYVVFFLTFLYLIGFVSNLAVPKTIDSGIAGPVGAAIVIDTLLILLFGLQHTVMARPHFKDRWIRLVPQTIERSTYVLLSSLILILLFWQWRPIPATVWVVDASALRLILSGIGLLGFLIVLYSTLLIDHFDLFGLRQVFLQLRGKPHAEKGFVTPSLYRFIRHPLYLGWLIAFWVTPHMTQGHLLFSILSTVYIFVAIPFEERDLMEILGDDYRRYREYTSMIIPLPGLGRRASSGDRSD
jgi:protein-S-isoprenylcysteine O-methyltransferase Ste14